MKATLLVVDDEPALRIALQDILEDEGFGVVTAVDGHQALDRLDAHPDIALIISDLRMPGMGGMDLLSKVSARVDAPGIIVITAHGDERTAVDAMKLGALDYFGKPFEVDDLLKVVRRALQTSDTSRENRRLKARDALSRVMIVASKPMERVAELVARLGPRDLPVLITGESGVGKELIARALVEASPRVHKPYVRFNCASVAPELAASELFGHVKGSYTGADHDRKGVFREADGGTLLLDEVAELAPRHQAMLLRVLQEGIVRPVGSDEEVSVDVRVIAATHSDLSQASTFRQDLYYRLRVVEIAVPALRDRHDDIGPLARRFCAEATLRFGMEPVTLSEEVIASLKQGSWPGNVRELKHAVERLVALSNGPVVTKDLLEHPSSPTDETSLASKGLRARVEAYERGILNEVLTASGGNRSETARRLRVNRATLLSKIRKHGLDED